MRNDVEVIDIKDWSTRELIKYLQDKELDTDQFFIDFEKSHLNDEQTNLVLYQDE